MNFVVPLQNWTKKMTRGDKELNGLDSDCKLHDIEYSKTNDINARYKADQDIAERQPVKAKDSNWGEKSDAFLVSNSMKAKSKLGMGIAKIVECRKELFSSTNI